MHVFNNVTEALPHLSAHILAGEEVGSRLGDRVMERLHQHIVILKPWQREVLATHRKAHLPAQIAETMWVLAGRNDVGFLENYLPRAKDFSDDGETWRGGYGPRIRRWEYGDQVGYVDQLAHVVELLRRDPLTRRAVISIYDPAVDTADGKDIPCNDFLMFANRLGKLDLHVVTRSNDLIWGWSGINAFEWSALQEIVASMVGVEMGELHFSINSLHVYDRHWKKADFIDKVRSPVVSWQTSPRFMGHLMSIETLDHLISQWFEVEEGIRTGRYSGVRLHEVLKDFPENGMMRSWLRVIAWWWTQDTSWLAELRGTALYTAAMETPVRKHEQPLTETITTGYQPGSFVTFVQQLHEEKDAAYGDSWKRRGEMMAILANIARKVDRLGVAGAGDTAADTVIDLLVYLVKYRLWLIDYQDAPIPEPVVAELPFHQVGHPYSDGTASVDVLLAAWGNTSAEVAVKDQLIQWLKDDFELLSYSAEHRDSVGPKVTTVERMIKRAAPLARHLWEVEQHG